MKNLICLTILLVSNVFAQNNCIKEGQPAFAKPGKTIKCCEGLHVTTVGDSLDFTCEKKKSTEDEEYSRKSHIKAEKYICSNKKEYSILRENQVGFLHTWKFIGLCSPDILKKKYYDSPLDREISGKAEPEDMKKCKAEDTLETRLCFYEYKALNESEGQGDFPEIVNGPDVFYSKDINCLVKKNISKKTSDLASKYRKVGKISVALNAKAEADRAYQQWVEVCNQKSKTYKDEEPMGVIKN